MLSLIKPAAILFCVLAVFHVDAPAQSVTISTVSAELAPFANAFLSSWLVKRNSRIAMRYVSANPALGKCDLLPGQTRPPQSGAQKRKIIQRMLAATLKAFPKYDRLDEAITPTKVPAANWFESTSSDTAQFLHLRHGRDGALVCKLDEALRYRNLLSRSNVYYVGFRVTNARNADLADWMTAWRKESGRWRLIAMGLLEN